jgi:phytoene synthase
MHHCHAAHSGIAPAHYKEWCMAAASQLAELVAMVRSGDYDRFLAIQRAPAVKRPALYALVGFSVELARVASLVSEPLLGHIRFAWWREGLQELESGKPARSHPVMLALEPVLKAHPALYPLLHAMLDARAADLDTSLIAMEELWRAYIDHTSGNLNVAMAIALDVQVLPAHEATIRADAQAYGMLALLRAIPSMTAQGWLRFPHARLNAHGLLSLEPSAALPAFVREVVANAMAVMVAASYPTSLKPLIAIRALNRHHASRIARVRFNPYRLSPSTLGAVWVALLA